MPRLKEIVIDSDHPAKLARFWEQIVDGYELREYDAAELVRLADAGLTPMTDPVVMLDGPGPTLCFHLRTGPRPERNRVHLDLATRDRPAEIARLLRLGASYFREGPGYTTLRDPEGNTFCLVDEL